MPFELIMLLGFFGAALLALLPAAPAGEAEERLSRRQLARRSDGETPPAGCISPRAMRLAAHRAGSRGLRHTPGKRAGRGP